MNVNQRELNQHVEFEPNTYYAAFSAELEASAYPMWALVSHLTDGSTADLTRKLLKVCLASLTEWFDAIAFDNPTVVNDSLSLVMYEFIKIDCFFRMIVYKFLSTCRCIDIWLCFCARLSPSRALY